VRETSSRRARGSTALRLLEALGSSLDIRQVLKEAYPLLSKLAPADYGALGVAPSANAAEFEWTVAELPDAFFAAYAEMAPHDFVRKAVAQRPNLVLRDQDMVARAELEQNMMYRRAREVGAPMEHVMAVMLHLDNGLQSGLSLYREQKKPFSAVERDRLQSVTPALANAVRNCHQFAMAADWKAALEGLLEDPAAAVVLAAADGSEVARSDGAAGMLERWFARHDRRGKRLPSALERALACAVDAAAPTTWHTCAKGLTLEVSLLPLTGHFGSARWMLRFQEHADGTRAPGNWRSQLTKREQQVTNGVLQGWDNRSIASELGCAQSTVKKHLQNIFEKLGLESRTALMARVSRG
jgi:DNA-binding CsgD family transcriptional regulator